MLNIKELIRDKSKLNQETAEELKTLVDKYPFYQSARLLYLENLFVLHSKEFGKELRKASVLVPDRRALFLTTEGMHYDIEKDNENNNIGKIETEEDSNRTISLIDNFLSSQKKEESNNITAPKRPSILDVTNDYASFLIRQNKDTEENSQEDNSSTPKLKGGELIDIFIEETKGKQRIDMPEFIPYDESSTESFISPEFSDEDEEIYTENMVNIYIRQGRYEQALEILKKISLNNPNKSTNFASQMKLLEVILNGNHD